MEDSQTMAWNASETTGGLQPQRKLPRLPPEVLRPLTRLNPWLFAAHIAIEWAIIVTTAWVCATYWSTPLYAVSVIVIGARLHALGVMAHDGAHFLISRHKRWNDFITEAFLAWPVFLSVTAYRAMHKNHHRYLNTQKDPDWTRNEPDKLLQSPTLPEFVSRFVGIWPKQLQLAAMMGHRNGATRASTDTARRAFRFAIYVALVGTALAYNAIDLLLLYWLVPLGTWFLVSMRIKGTSEHFAVESSVLCNAARTILPNPLEQFLIAPKNVHYHIEHHLYPAVPFYKLPQLHAKLSAVPEYQAHAHITRGYWRFFSELITAWRTVGCTQKPNLGTHP